MKAAKTKLIYVLYGIAGIGKSTVAKTVAENAAGNGTLGGSFFFARDEDSRKSAKMFFSTLAYNLAYRYPSLTTPVNAALEKDPELTGRGPHRQFDCLIAQPLRTLPKDDKPILLVQSITVEWVIFLVGSSTVQEHWI